MPLDSFVTAVHALEDGSVWIRLPNGRNTPVNDTLILLHEHNTPRIDPKLLGGQQAVVELVDAFSRPATR
jgi:hypothetical protein